MVKSDDYFERRRWTDDRKSRIVYVWRKERQKMSRWNDFLTRFEEEEEILIAGRPLSCGGERIGSGLLSSIRAPRGEERSWMVVCSPLSRSWNVRTGSKVRSFLYCRCCRCRCWLWSGGDGSRNQEFSEKRSISISACPIYLLIVAKARVDMFFLNFF